MVGLSRQTNAKQHTKNPQNLLVIKITFSVGENLENICRIYERQKVNSFFLQKINPEAPADRKKWAKCMNRQLTQNPQRTNEYETRCSGLLLYSECLYSSKIHILGDRGCNLVLHPVLSLLLLSAQLGMTGVCYSTQLYWLR
jgi:hypothetical protein